MTKLYLRYNDILEAIDVSDSMRSVTLLASWHLWGNRRSRTLLCRRYAGPFPVLRPMSVHWGKPIDIVNNWVELK